MHKLEWREKCYALLVKPDGCERCEQSGHVTLHYSRTAYHDKRMFPSDFETSRSRWPNLEVDLPTPSAEWGERERKVDPNAPNWLCAECVAEDVAFWDEQWAEYYSGLM